MTTLLLSNNHSADNQRLWKAAIARGWRVERLPGIVPPPDLDGEVVIYLSPLLAPTVAARLGLALVEPPADWLVRLPERYRKRSVEISNVRAARLATSPRFVKPPNDKSFEARVYSTGAELPDDVDEASTVLVAEPVAFEVEYRCFVRDGAVVTLSPYLRHGRLAEFDRDLGPIEERTAALAFAEALLSDPSVPSVGDAIVLDVGRIADRGWAAVELNAAWGAGLYLCDAAEAIETIRRSMTTA